jgi:polyhydroxyalkanoate synthesis regulator phasin
MTTQNGKNFVESVLDAQKNLVDNLVENTKKVTNGNSFINEAIDKGTESYKKWMEQQKNVMSGVTQKAEGAQETAKENINKANEFSQNWLNNQINWVKQAWEMNQNFVKTHTPNADTFKTPANPMEWFNTMNNNWNKMSSWMNQANEASQQANQWMNMMQQFSPANATENFKKTTENYTGLFNQYFELLNSSFTEMQKNMHNGTSKDVYGNMMNAAASFGKFSEIWAPFFKSIQDNNFNAEAFKKTFNVGAYKEMMDKFFGFMPENSRQYMQQASEWMQNGMKGYGDFGKTGFAQGREFMNNMNPFAGQNVFENVLNGYQQMQSTFQNAVAPIAKMVTPNQFTKSATDWSDIADRMAIFNIKNAELQYLMYQQGNKVMDKLVENITNKIENGTEINSMTALYQEWLNISDKVFVELFESDDYSKLMAEVSALQLKLRKEMDLQAEKMLGGLPVATRSEMDELYKVIYELKKEVRQLEKMLDIDSNEPSFEEPQTEQPIMAAKKTATKK